MHWKVMWRNGESAAGSAICKSSSLHYSKPSGCHACAAGDLEAYPIVGLVYFMMEQELSSLGATLLSAPPA